MTIVYSDNFEGDATGSLPGGWANIGSSVAAVTTTNPVQGSKSLGQSATVDGLVTLYTGQSSLTDQDVVLVAQVVFINGFGFVAAQPLCCDDGTGNNHYLLIVNATSTILYKRVAGSYTTLSTVAHGLTIAVGDLIWSRIRKTISTNTLAGKVWKDGTSEPGTFSNTLTDTTFGGGAQGARFGSSNAGTAYQINLDAFAVDNLSSGGATAITLSGPTTGTVGSPSTNFTVGANGTITGTVVITPNDGGAGGTFTPTTVSINTGSPTGTFTYTAASAGAKTISTTNNGSLTNPTPITYTASSSGTVTFPVTNANLYFSPFNWYSDGSGAMAANNIKGSSTLAWANNRGAYMRFKVTVGAAGTIALNVSTTTLASLPNPAGCPTLSWSIAGGTFQTHLLASGDTQVTLATGLAAGTYECDLFFRSVWILQDGLQADTYVNPLNRVQVTGLTVSTGGTLSAPTLKPNTMLAYGDSITECDINISGTRSASSQDANQGYAYFLAQALNAEIGIVGWYGQTWPFLQGSWDKYSGVPNSRLIAGLLSPAPTYITVNYGQNDGNPGPTVSVVNATLAAIAAAAPSSKMIVIVPFSGTARTNLLLATLPSNAILVDLNQREMLQGNTEWSFDGTHPDVQGHANLAPRLAGKIIGATFGLASRTVTVTLTSDGTTPIPNLSGLKWAFFDQTNPTTFATPVSSGVGATTNSSGVFSVAVTTSLASGGIGWLLITNSDGTTTQLPAESCFSGPVAVT